MPNTGEYLNENSERSYPFRSSTADAAPIPLDFIVSLRLFLSANQEVNVYISEITYNSTADTYFLEFSNDAGVVLDGTIDRTDLGAPRKFKKTVLGSGQTVCLFTPGPLWDDPSWGGGGNWTENYTIADSVIETSAILPGPSPFRRMLIDGESDPRGGVWPLDISQSLIGGYNVGLSIDRDQNTFTDDGGILIEAGAGLGLGYLPLEEETTLLPITRINEVTPDEFGNINLSAEDCLRVFTPVFNGLPIDNALQIESDCIPCCPCSSYSKMSASISRRSNNIKAQCETLASTQADAAMAYRLGMDYIILHRKNIIVSEGIITRDFILDSNSLIFTLQNRAAYPAYAYFSVVISGVDPPPSISVDSPVSAVVIPPPFPPIHSPPTFEDCVNEDLNNFGISPLLPDGTGSLTFPTNITNEMGLPIRVGYHKQKVGVFPFPSGGSGAVRLGLSTDIRQQGVKITVRTVNRFGHYLFYGKLGHRTIARVFGNGNNSTIITY